MKGYGFAIGFVLLTVAYLVGMAMTRKPKPIPPVTDYEKLRLEMDALRRTQEAILIYVRDYDAFVDQFRPTRKRAGIPKLPGVKR